MTNARGLILILLLSLLSAGCGNRIVKDRWRNFTAYYNTFYNAENYFKRGKIAVDKQKLTINPERPIRVNLTPMKAGATDFEKSIEKSADVLRRYEESKWADDAIFLIGKSYYYLQQYFPADQKFVELLNTSSNGVLKQEAVVWRGMAMLQMDRFSEGINWLRAELNSDEYNWSRRNKALAELVIAEMFVGLEQYDNALTFLEGNIPLVRDKELKARAWFLKGQLHERLSQYEQAFVAFSEVEKGNPDYELIFNALRKKADVARKTNREDLALRIFKDMANDDKNIEILPDLQYEIAQTKLLMGDIASAETEFKYTVRSKIRVPAKETAAKIYYGLADIYRYHKQDFNTAAAYYDSAAQRGTDLSRLPEWFNAKDLALAFGDYAKLKKEANHIDSLLWLASLNKAQLDSVVQTIIEAKKATLLEEQKRLKAASNTLVNLDAVQQQNQQQSTAESGFLNHKNPTLVQQNKAAFRQTWGNRPLVDNWRRMEAVQQSLASAAQQEGTVSKGTTTTEVVEIKVDLSEVPFEPEAKKEKRKRVALLDYEIGNVFFLSLNMPDSARVYYRKVIDDYPETDFVPQAMFSMSETYFLDGKNEDALAWANTLIEAYPRTKYADRLSERWNIKREGVGFIDVQDSIRTAYYTLVEQLPTETPMDNAERLRRFAMKHSISEKGGDALYYAANEYMRVARSDSSFNTKVEHYFRIRTDYEQHRTLLAAMKDSSEVALMDTTLAPEKKAYWKAIADSVIKPPDFYALFPYKGAHWDSTRVVLTQLSSTFTRFKQLDKVKALLEQLKVPPPPKEPEKKDVPQSSAGLLAPQNSPKKE